MAKELSRFTNKVWLKDGNGKPFKRFLHHDEWFEDLIPYYREVVEAMYEGEEIQLEIANSFQLYQMEPAKRKKTKEGATVYYRKDENGELVEYVRGQGIADYHNSQVKSKLNKARMTGSDKQLSKAMGFIITLPKDYIQGIIPDLSDHEYEYLVTKLEAEQNHQPFKTDEVYETSLNMKFCKHEWTEEEMEKAKKFLLAGKDSVLEEMGIREEDVLFYAIHFDESFPHIHCMALPTCEKTYEEDIYSKKQKKDGTYTLLHKKGETDISYGVGKYYAERDKDGEYVFFKNFHQNVVDRMEEKGYDAEGLVNGVTSEKCFDPSTMNQDQRKQSVRKAMEILALQKKLKEIEAEKNALEADKVAMQEEFDEKQSSMQQRLDELREQRDTARTEVQSIKQEKAKAQEELEQAKDLLEEKQLELDEQVAKIASMRELIKDLKEELARLVKEVALFVPNVVKAFIGAWKNAKTISQMEKVDTEAREEAIAGAKALTENLRTFGTRAEALLAEEEVVSGVKMATFEKTDQKVGFAKKQIQKLAEATGQAEAFEDARVMNYALSDWFNKEKYEEVLAHKSEVEASLYMKAPLRAERAIEYALEKIEEAEMELG